MPTISLASLETYHHHHHHHHHLHPNTYAEHKIKPSNPDSNSNSNSNSDQQHDPDSSSHNNSSSASLIINPNSNPAAAAATAAEEEASAAATASPPIYIMRSPALYTTPSHQQLQLGHAAPVWDSSPTSPSPYRTNSKRRRGGGSNANAIPLPPPPPVHHTNQNQTDEVVIIDDHQGNGDPHLLATAIAKAKAKSKSKAEAAAEERVYDDDDADADADADELEEDGDFFESRDSMSIASSSSDAEDRSTLPRSRHRHYPFGLGHQSPSISTQSLTQSDYYDAADDFFSDGSVSNSSPSFCVNINKELKALRLSLIEESERRKKAETDLLYIHMQWQRIAAYLSQVGFSFPEIQQSGNVQLDLDPAEICQEIIVTRFVYEAIERALARAETEVITEAIIVSKNHEISRLRDRLQYYEAMNREMSQRNQEAVELTRQQRLKRKTKWRLIWGCVGLSVTFGASLLAYSYLPNSGKHSLPTSSPDT